MGTPLQSQVKDLFEEYQDLAKKLYVLCRLMKSQDKLDSETFDDAVLDFIIAWNSVFPDIPYFNKLHFVMMHLPDFVEDWEICGRASAESHESVHARFARRKANVSRMVSTVQRYKTLFSRSVANLRDGIAEKQAIINKKKGNKRGKYNTTRATKRDDRIDFYSSIFAGTETVHNEVFLILIDGSRLPERYRNQYLFVKVGRAPDSWAQCFADSKMLSAAKVEQASHATY